MQNSLQPITKKDLGEFAENILLPAMEKIIDERVPKIIDERVPKIIDERVPGIINKAKLEIIDHVDDKIADLRGDIILLLRKEDRRIQLLIDKLRKKNILEDKDIKELDEIKVFAHA
jgi:hypothetical protein